MRPIDYTGIDATITQSGDATIVVLELDLLSATGENEIVKATGTAKRAPGDRHDPETATLLALGRALEKLGAKVLKQGNGRVRHNDWLKANKKRIRPEGSTPNTFEAWKRVIQEAFRSREGVLKGQFFIPIDGYTSESPTPTV